MPDVDDDVESMVTDLHASHGRTVTYARGASSASVTMSKHRQQSFQVDNGNGGIIEVQPIDWVCLTDDLPYGDPVRGDTITVSGVTYEVLPTTSEKVFRRINDAMTRVHTKQISGS